MDERAEPHERVWARLGWRRLLGGGAHDDEADMDVVVMRVQLPNEPSSATVARGLVAALLERRGTSGESLADVVLAVSEASSNAIEYGIGRHLDLCVELAGGRCSVSVRNRVPPDRPRGDPLPGADMPPEHAMRGRGVAIIELVMDDVAWEIDDEQCTVEMSRQLDVAS